MSYVLVEGLELRLESGHLGLPEIWSEILFIKCLSVEVALLIIMVILGFILLDVPRPRRRCTSGRTRRGSPS